MVVADAKESPHACRLPPPKVKICRSADSVKSGIVPIGVVEKLLTINEAIGEAVQILGGRAGQYHAAEAYRRFPYGKAIGSLGNVKNKVVPRLYFSRHIARDPKINVGVGMPYNHQLRYDYDARFDLGTGPMAADEENRIIRSWSPEMEALADTMWKLMRSDPRYRRLCRTSNQFNHVSVHAYRAGNNIKPHEDRRRNRRNSMRRNTPVAVFTVGSPKELHFF